MNNRLIENAALGDQDAFNLLILDHQDIAFNLAVHLLGDSYAAEDAVQNAFIAAYRGLANFRGGSFKAWILRTVTNICYDELRRRRRRPTVPLEPRNSQTEEEIESPAWLVDGALTPEQQLEAGMVGAAIQDCIQRLPLQFRAIVILVDVQGCDYREAAQVVAKPLGTVKSRLARARLRLRNCLGASGLEIDGCANAAFGDAARAAVPRVTRVSWQA